MKDSARSMEGAITHRPTEKSVAVREVKAELIKEEIKPEVSYAEQHKVILDYIRGLQRKNNPNRIQQIAAWCVRQRPDDFGNDALKESKVRVPDFVQSILSDLQTIILNPNNRDSVDCLENRIVSGNYTIDVDPNGRRVFIKCEEYVPGFLICHEVTITSGLISYNSYLKDTGYGDFGVMPEQNSNHRSTTIRFNKDGYPHTKVISRGNQANLQTPLTVSLCEGEINLNPGNLAIFRLALEVLQSCVDIHKPTLTA